MIPLYHYTNHDGYNAIRATVAWMFLASKPPGDHPVGAYFTTLAPSAPKLAKRLRIPKEKLKYFFCFADVSDLSQLDGGRGEFIFYSPDDYLVEAGRQLGSGPTEN